MSIRRFALIAAAVVSLGVMPGSAEAQQSQRPAYGAARLNTSHAVTGVSSTVVLTITTPSPIYYGQIVDGYANVTTSDGSTPSGTITFYDGAQSICVISVTQGGSCPASAGSGFAAGTHVLTAVYSGDTSHSGSTSNAVTVTVLPNGTTVSLMSSANPATFGQSVMFTATVAPVGSSLRAPTGVVTFLDGSVVLGSGTLNGSGVATFSTAALSAGSHNVTASYAGDANTAASVSAVLTETVTGSGVAAQDGFSVTVTGPTTVGVGRMADLTVAIAPVQGYAQPVELSCADLPWEAACTFGVHTIPAGGGTTTLRLSTFAPHDCGSTTPYFAGLPFAGPALAGLVMLFLPRKRRLGLKGLLVALIAVCGMAALTGCGNCTDLGTRPGTYTIRVIGTATGANSSPGGVVTTKVRVRVVVE